MSASIARSSAVALLLFSGCSASPKDSPDLEVASAFRERASRIGCEPNDADYFGAAAFSCIKRIAPCGCALLVKADTTSDTKPRINLIRVDVLGCRAGEANDTLGQLLDPLVRERERGAFHDFIGRPHLTRSQEQEARLAVLQSAVHGGVGVRAQFGAQPSSHVGAARRTIWIDSNRSPAREELVPDSPIDVQCPLAAESSERGRGYCDTAPEGVAPCELDREKRSRYRQRIALVVSKTISEWQEAIRALLRERKLQPSTDAGAEAQAQALLGVLPAAAGVTVTPSPGSKKAGVSGVQLASEAASEWRERMTWGVENLFDADLAALMLALPAPEQVSAIVFAERIQRRLDAGTHQTR